MMMASIKTLARRAPYLRRLVRDREALASEVEQLRQELELQRNVALSVRDGMNAEVDTLTARVRQLETELAEQRRVVEGRKPAYSHWGEDQVLGWLFDKKTDGFYVDVGSYHPNLYSNTKVLHDRGWRGINVDCNPSMIAFFNQLRPKDTNLNVAVGPNEGKVKFFLFHEWASSNTVSPSFAEAISKAQQIEVKKEIELDCFPLRTLLERHLPEGQKIDFLNVDVESLDLSVVESNDWSRFRPLVVAIEDLEFTFDAPNDSPVYRFMKGQGYRPISRSIYTSFYVDEGRRSELNGCP